MKIVFYLLAFIAGILLAVQAGFNTRLTSLIRQPLIASIASFSSSTLTAILILFISQSSVPIQTFHKVPFYLWFIGGIFSCIGISLYFYTIPKIGISNMITLGLCGQILFAMLAGKYGLFGLPIEEITNKKVLGIFAMILAIILINTK